MTNAPPEIPELELDVSHETVRLCHSPTRTHLEEFVGLFERALHSGQRGRGLYVNYLRILKTKGKPEEGNYLSAIIRSQ